MGRKSWRERSKKRKKKEKKVREKEKNGIHIVQTCLVTTFKMERKRRKGIPS